MNFTKKIYFDDLEIPYSRNNPFVSCLLGPKHTSVSAGLQKSLEIFAQLGVRVFLRYVSNGEVRVDNFMESKENLFQVLRNIDKTRKMYETELLLEYSRNDLLYFICLKLEENSLTQLQLDVSARSQVPLEVPCEASMFMDFVRKKVDANYSKYLQNCFEVFTSLLVTLFEEAFDVSAREDEIQVSYYAPSFTDIDVMRELLDKKIDKKFYAKRYPLEYHLHRCKQIFSRREYWDFFDYYYNYFLLTQVDLKEGTYSFFSSQGNEIRDIQNSLAALERFSLYAESNFDPSVRKLEENDAKFASNLYREIRGILPKSNAASAVLKTEDGGDKFLEIDIDFSGQGQNGEKCNGYEPENDLLFVDLGEITFEVDSKDD